jgi:hypothetical protein
MHLIPTTSSRLRLDGIANLDSGLATKLGKLPLFPTILYKLSARYLCFQLIFDTEWYLLFFRFLRLV